jgi:Rrf2 family protein
VHACALLAATGPDGALPAARLAEYHGVPAAYMAKHLQALAGAGILRTEKGRRGGYRLARPAAEITVLDVVEAIDGTDPAFQCTEIRRRGPAAVAVREYRHPCGIARVFAAADAAWRAALAAITIDELVAGVAREAPPLALERAAAWLQQALR